MIGAEGKLFQPLAFTKTFALAAAVLIVGILLDDDRHDASCIASGAELDGPGFRHHGADSHSQFWRNVHRDHDDAGRSGTLLLRPGMET